MEAGDNGFVRLSTPGFRSLRYLVWQHFRKEGKPARIASIHLPAFYNKPNKAGEYPNRVEYDKQEPKVAEWFSSGPHRILGGDFNGQIGNHRLRHITPIGRWSRKVPSGPSGQPIDYVGSNKAGFWHPVKTQVHRPVNSDHNAVIVTFEWRE